MISNAPVRRGFFVKTMNIHQDKILILDFGSQVSQLIARRVRELGVYCELHPFDMDPAAIHAFAPKGVILSGGPESTHDAGSPRAPECVFTLGVPVLGICYGMQTMAVQLGGAVAPGSVKEFGYAELTVLPDSELLQSGSLGTAETSRAPGHRSLFDGIQDRRNEEGHGLLDVWMSHGDFVSALPAGFTRIASTHDLELAGMADAARGFYAVQFHPEVTHTTQGKEIYRRFVHDICGCGAAWTPSNIADDAIAKVRAQVGNKKVLLGLSGGVDSSVVAALLHKAIGTQLTCVFVDNGLLRLNEGEAVMQLFADNLGVKVIRVDAEQRFLSQLAGVSDPEAKRKIIGRVFIEVFEEQAKLLEDVEFLAQGTIYPDVIESAGATIRLPDGSVRAGKAHVIKSHHNVGGLPAHMRMQLVEPLRELFKDEVRALGVELGLSREMVYRHPFPGPGLGVRILGAVDKASADTLRRADAIFIEELRRAGWYDKTAQAFAVFLPVKSVGVTGDGRRYDPVIALRAVQTIDFMTAHWAHLPYELLDVCSRRIVNEVPGVSRVVYDISGKPPATIEWE